MKYQIVGLIDLQLTPQAGASKALRAVLGQQLGGDLVDVRLHRPEVLAEIEVKPDVDIVRLQNVEAYQALYPALKDVWFVPIQEFSGVPVPPPGEPPVAGSVLTAGGAKASAGTTDSSSEAEGSVGDGGIADKGDSGEGGSGDTGGSPFGSGEIKDTGSEIVTGASASEAGTTSEGPAS